MRKYFIALLMAITMIGFGGVSIAAPSGGSKGGLAADVPDQKTQAAAKGDKDVKGEKSQGEKGAACPEPTNRHPDPPTPGCGQCPEGQEKVKGECVANCRADQERNNRGQCVCPAGQVESQGKCVPECREDQVRDSDGRCVCPAGQVESQGRCVTPPTCAKGFADGSALPVLGEQGTVRNSAENETGSLSKLVHGLEDHDPTANRLPSGGPGVVHEVNCTAVITVESLRP